MAERFMERNVSVSWRHNLGRVLSYGNVVFGVVNGLILFLLLIVVDFTSPLHPRYVSLMDVNVFRLAGKVWAEGGLPYVDYWDHKGPLIFFTNMLGYLLVDDGSGVFWVNAVLVLVAAYFIWKLDVELLGKVPIFIQLLALWIPILWFIPCVGNIDTTETVCLPFLAAGAWLAVRDARRLDAGSGSVSWVTALVLGLGFSAGLMTRLTNALMVCVFAFVLAVALAMRGLWVDLGRCVLGFLGGVLVLSVPFVVYFAVNGALYDMIYGTLLYNFEYVSNTSASNFLSREGAETLCIPMLLIASVIAVIIVNRRIAVLSVMMLLAGVSLIVLFLISGLLGHYSAICVVLWPYIITLFAHIRWKIIGIGLLILMLAYSSVWLISQYRHLLGPTYENATIERIIDKSDSVILYNINTVAYLRYDITPLYKFATVQDWQSSFSQDYREDLINAYANGDVEYILVQKNWRNDDITIQPVLDSRYELVEKGDDGVLVYRLADKAAAGDGGAR